MDFRIELAQSAPEHAEMNAILRDYYDMSNIRLVEAGGPEFSVDDAIRDFWDHIRDVLPPDGRLCLARNSRGDPIGCGTLARVGKGIGEMKRLFVRPEARGTGLGRALVDIRIAAAREMGLSTLIADTLRKNVEMQHLYKSLGFREVPPHTQSGTVEGFPELAPHLLYFRLDLGA